MPGTPMAKSHSLSSVYAFTCFGFISCSASDLRSSGLSAGKSRASRSPFSRIVGGRPTLRCRSEAFFCTSCCITALKSKAGVAAPAGAGLGGAGLAIRIDAEEHLTVFHRMRVLSQQFLDDARELGLDLVHDLHRLDDAERLSFLDTLTHGDERLAAGFRRMVVRAHHRGLHFQH